MTSFGIEVVLREAGESDLAIARKLLTDAGLPTADLTIESLALVAEIEGVVAGLIGLEQFRNTGLLRSLVIAEEHRHAGLGRVLVGALEQLALEKNIAELWLLTIDADKWFASLGYLTQSRDAAPVVIQSTEEFSSLCPGDAVLMKKILTA
jgi:amino-acid N-acetyltransferase